ncbi:uncharacterized protein LOC129742545 isoform X1 [Uranotaenia lowii]|uniref:uncharacterized protein LOC129742545 isoform X1 n=1 Tax=Uranotaenia lowii TaxID=190385 RepID=UPI0024792C17|nr:uncharacterized protein LOC129742545 isoform X1 [Uranotaenia lowii]XP_055590436.1 uncharacterized protein LOC129742545 isoform X1 [Uranotaenia lowii]
MASERKKISIYYLIVLAFSHLVLEISCSIDDNHNHYKIHNLYGEGLCSSGRISLYDNILSQNDPIKLHHPRQGYILKQSWDLSSLGRTSYCRIELQAPEGMGFYITARETQLRKNAKAGHRLHKLACTNSMIPRRLFDLCSPIHYTNIFHANTNDCWRKQQQQQKKPSPPRLGECFVQNISIPTDFTPTVWALIQAVPYTMQIVLTATKFHRISSHLYKCCVVYGPLKGECVDTIQVKYDSNQYDFCDSYEAFNKLRAFKTGKDVRITINISKHIPLDHIDDVLFIELVVTVRRNCGTERQIQCDNDGSGSCISPHFRNDDIINCPDCRDEFKCLREKSELQVEYPSDVILAVVLSLIMTTIVLGTLIWCLVRHRRGTTGYSSGSRSSNTDQNRSVQIPNSTESNLISNANQRTSENEFVPSAPLEEVEDEEDQPPRYEALYNTINKRIT